MLNDSMNNEEHFNQIIKKMNKNMYVIYKLKKLNVEKRIIKMAFNAMIRSQPSYCLAIFGENILKKQQSRLNYFYKKATKLKLYNAINFEEEKDQSQERRALNIIKNKKHQSRTSLIVLPHGRLSMPYCRTERYLKSWLPQLILYINKKQYKI